MHDQKSINSREGGSTIPPVLRAYRCTCIGERLGRLYEDTQEETFGVFKILMVSYSQLRIDKKKKNKKITTIKVKDMDAEKRCTDLLGVMNDERRQ